MAWQCNVELSPQRCLQVHESALLQPGVAQQAIQGQMFLRLLGQAAPHKFLAVWRERRGLNNGLIVYDYIAMVVYVCTSACLNVGVCLTW